MKEINVKGSFYEMGLQYGKACKKEIKRFCFLMRIFKIVYFIEYLLIVVNQEKIQLCQ